MTNDFDWQKVEDTAFEFIINSVNSIHQQHPQEHIYGAIFHCFYGDGKNIYPPALSIGTEELLSNIVDKYEQNPRNSDETREKLTSDLRWSGADLADYMFDSDDKLNELSKEVTKYAKLTSGYDFDDKSINTEENIDKWSEIYEEFLSCFPRACKRATPHLLESGIVTQDFIAVANDETQDLVPASLTSEQLKKHFPYLIEV